MLSDNTKGHEITQNVLKMANDIYFKAKLPILIKLCAYLHQFKDWMPYSFECQIILPHFFLVCHQELDNLQFNNYYINYYLKL